MEEAMIAQRVKEILQEKIDSGSVGAGMRRSRSKSSRRRTGGVARKGCTSRKLVRSYSKSNGKKVKGYQRCKPVRKLKAGVSVGGVARKGCTSRKLVRSYSKSNGKKVKGYQRCKPIARRRAGDLMVLKRMLGSGSKSSRRTNPWVTHVKRYAKAHKITYGEALMKARASYRG